MPTKSLKYVLIIIISILAISLAGWSQLNNDNADQESSGPAGALNFGSRLSNGSLGTGNNNQTESGNQDNVVSIGETYVSQSPVIAGDEFMIAFEAVIHPDYYIYSAEPDNPAGTEIIDVSDAADFNVVPVYPEPEEYTFLNHTSLIYKGTVLFYASITADETMANQSADIELQLKTKPCNAENHVCLPNIVYSNISIPILIKPDGTEFSVLNEDIFSNVEAYSAPETSQTDDEKGVSFDLRAKIEDLLSAERIGLALLFLFLAGILLNLLPCVLPVIPLTINFFSNQSRDASKLKLAGLGMFYMLGIVLMFSILGTVAAVVGRYAFILDNPYIWIFFILLMILLALNQFGLYELPVPGFAGSASSKSGVFGALLMGLMIGVIALPCIGAPVIAVFSWIADRIKEAEELGISSSKIQVQAFFMFFVMGLGMGLPYLILAIFTSLVMKLPKPGNWMIGLKQIFAFIILALGLYFMKYLISKNVHEYLFAIFLIAAPSVLLFLKTGNDSKTFHTIKRILIILTIVWGSFSLSTAINQPPYEFVKYDRADFNEILGNKPVVIFFSSTTCTNCEVIEDMIRFDPEMQKNIEQIDFILAKRTVYDTEDDQRIIELEKQYNIQYNPVIVFINRDGKEVSSFRIEGIPDNTAELIKSQINMLMDE